MRKSRQLYTANYLFFLEVVFLLLEEDLDFDFEEVFFFEDPDFFLAAMS